MNLRASVLVVHLVGWSVGWSVRRLVCHNFVKRQGSFTVVLLSEHMLNTQTFENKAHCIRMSNNKYCVHLQIFFTLNLESSKSGLQNVIAIVQVRGLCQLGSSEGTAPADKHGSAATRDDVQVISFYYYFVTRQLNLYVVCERIRCASLKSCRNRMKPDIRTDECFPNRTGSVKFILLIRLPLAYCVEFAA